MRASLIITTKDRKDNLRRAILSALKQTEPIEIIVLDDGSTDGTSKLVETEFPEVRLDRTPNARGLVVQRNRGAAMASSEIIFSIDDDAEFSTPQVIEQTLAGFSHPRIGAIAIPYVEPDECGLVSQRAPTANGLWVNQVFRGTAYAMRRDVFLHLGGYREEIVHQGEEIDFCIRLLNSGLVVRLGHGDVIIHRESPKRDWRRQDFYGRWNDIMFAWRNVPMPYFPVHLLATTFNGFSHALRTRSVSDVRGIMSAYLAMILWPPLRTPVTTNSYRLHRLLKKQGPRKLCDIEGFLSPLMLPVRER